MVDAELVQHQLGDFDSLAKVLPMEDQQELFALLLREVQVYPFDPEGSDQEFGERFMVAKMRSRLCRIEMAVHHLSKGAVECLPEGESSETHQIGSP